MWFAYFSTKINIYFIFHRICAEESRAQPHNAMTICSSLTDCQSCVQTSLHCGWCPQQGLCTYGVRCKEPLATAMGFTTLRVNISCLSVFYCIIL